MKSKIIITLGAMALTIVLVLGVSYAWFTDEARAGSTSVEAGYLDISLTGVPSADGNIFPADVGKTVEYTIRNSSNREVVAQFKTGALTAYVMPDSYRNGEYITKDNHEKMKKLLPEQKMDKEASGFDKIDNVPTSDVTSDLVGSWIFVDDGSEYLGKDIEGNQYFRMSKGGTAKGMFKVALTEDAGNKYQYALFTLGEATVLATQNNTAAIAAAFDGLDITALTK